MKWLVLAAVAACGSRSSTPLTSTGTPAAADATPVTAKRLACRINDPDAEDQVFTTAAALRARSPDCAVAVDFTRQVVVVVTEGDTNSGRLRVAKMQRRGSVLEVDVEKTPQCAGGQDRGNGEPVLYTIEARGVTKVERQQHDVGPAANNCPVGQP